MDRGILLKKMIDDKKKNIPPPSKTPPSKTPPSKTPPSKIPPAKTPPIRKLSPSKTPPSKTPVKGSALSTNTIIGLILLFIVIVGVGGTVYMLLSKK